VDFLPATAFLGAAFFTTAFFAGDFAGAFFVVEPGPAFFAAFFGWVAEARFELAAFA